MTTAPAEPRVSDDDIAILLSGNATAAFIMSVSKGDLVADLRDARATIKAMAADIERLNRVIATREDALRQLAKDLTTAEAALKAAREMLRAAEGFARDYAASNPAWTDGFRPTQDPNGVHTWLQRYDALTFKEPS